MGSQQVCHLASGLKVGYYGKWNCNLGAQNPIRILILPCHPQ